MLALEGLNFQLPYLMYMKLVKLHLLDVQSLVILRPNCPKICLED